MECDLRCDETHTISIQSQTQFHIRNIRHDLHIKSFQQLSFIISKLKMKSIAFYLSTVIFFEILIFGQRTIDQLMLSIESVTI